MAHYKTEGTFPLWQDWTERDDRPLLRSFEEAQFDPLFIESKLKQQLTIIVTSLKWSDHFRIGAGVNPAEQVREIRAFLQHMKASNSWTMVSETMDSLGSDGPFSIPLILTRHYHRYFVARRSQTKSDVSAITHISEALTKAFEETLSMIGDEQERHVLQLHFEGISINETAFILGLTTDEVEDIVCEFKGDITNDPVRRRRA